MVGGALAAGQQGNGPENPDIGAENVATANPAETLSRSAT
jgi:hypothetical protein